MQNVLDNLSSHNELIWNKAADYKLFAEDTFIQPSHENAASRQSPHHLDRIEK